MFNKKKIKGNSILMRHSNKNDTQKHLACHSKFHTIDEMVEAEAVTTTLASEGT